MFINSYLYLIKITFYPMDFFINLLFIIYLISGLLAGAWVFYEFFFNRAFLFKDDLFSLDFSDEKFNKIDNHFDTIEENQKTIIEILEKYKQDEKS